MKKKIVKLLFLLFVMHFSLSAQGVNANIKSDTITVYYNELSDIDYRFKIVFDDFIKHMPFSLHKRQRTNYIYVSIYPYLTSRAQECLIDSLYRDNDFQKSMYIFPYDVYIESIRKESNRLSLSDFQTCYLYNYKGFDVIIVTPLKIKFPWVASTGIKQYIVSEKDDFSTTYFSVYTVGEYEVVNRKYIKLYSQPSGVPLQKKYFPDKEKSDLLKRK